MTRLQRQDAAVSFRQGESIRRLTLLNMIFLPPSFIAGVFGMNTLQTTRTPIWVFCIFAVALSALTMVFAIFKINRVSPATVDANEHVHQEVLKRIGNTLACSFRVTKQRYEAIPQFNERVKQS